MEYKTVGQTLVALIEEYRQESDRAAGILLGVSLDKAVETLLRRFFVKDDAVTERLFGETQVLNSFAPKIDLAFGLGLLTADHRDSLHALRRIRNNCAHHQVARFSDSPIRELAAKAFKPFEKEVKSSVPTHDAVKHLSPERFQVLVAAFALLTILELYSRRVRREERRQHLTQLTTEMLTPHPDDLVPRASDEMPSSGA